MGTCRTLTNEAQSLILDNMQRIAISIAEAHGAHAEVIIKQGGYPNTNNHPKEARFMAKMMREIVGENNAHDNVLPAMTAEDFGLCSRRYLAHMDGLGMVTMRFLKGIFIVHHMTSMIKTSN